jgi:hypothetical protein
VRLPEGVSTLPPVMAVMGVVGRMRPRHVIPAEAASFRHGTLRRARSCSLHVPLRPRVARKEAPSWAERVAKIPPALCSTAERSPAAVGTEGCEGSDPFHHVAED